MRKDRESAEEEERKKSSTRILYWSLKPGSETCQGVHSD